MGPGLLEHVADDLARHVVEVLGHGVAFHLTTLLLAMLAGVARAASGQRA